MKINLVGKNAELARTWVPFMIGAYREGATVPGMDFGARIIRHEDPFTTGDPGKVHLDLGMVRLTLPYPGLREFIDSGFIALDGSSVHFPDRWPHVAAVAGGLKLTWTRKPQIKDAGFVAGLIQPEIAEVFVFPDRIDIRIDRAPDRIITWE